MKRRDFTRALLLSGGAAMLLPAVGLAAVEDSPVLKEIKERGTLRIGVFAGTEPYYHKDLVSGEWSGFCIDMGKNLAEHIGVELETVETTWGNSVIELQSGKIDVMFGLSNNPERARVVDFTQPIVENTFTVLVPATLEVSAWEDLNKPEMRVAVDLGSTQDAFARKTLPNSHLVALKGADETILALRANRADAIIQVVLLAVVTAKNLGPQFKLVVPEPQGSQPTTMGVRRDPNGEFRDFVDSWLTERRQDGSVSTWVTDSLALVGVTPDMLPENLKF